MGPLSTALTALLTHKLRSFLTILGVVIGISAVIILMSLGKGTEAQILKNISSLGANTIYVRPGTLTIGGGGVRETAGPGAVGGSASTLTLEDAQAIADEVPNIDGIAPTQDYPVQVIAGNENANVSITGITPDYQYMNNLQLQEGDYINQQEYDANQRVALIGDSVSDTLFQGDDPVGKPIRMGNAIFTIVGLLQSQGTGFFNSTDDMILVPLSTLHGQVSRSITTTGQHVVNSIQVHAMSQEYIGQVKNDITTLLEQRHHIPVGGTGDFSVTSADQIASTITASANSLTLLLGAIAGISLLVGGIGVMNIMLVSVMERRREIGIRKALGAKERDIWGQFLVESAFLAFTGGIIGTGLGWGGSYLISRSGSIPALVTPDIIILAVTVSVAIGIFFGFYPAWQGSRLDPIRAIRVE